MSRNLGAALTAVAVALALAIVWYVMQPSDAGSSPTAPSTTAEAPTPAGADPAPAEAPRTPTAAAAGSGAVAASEAPPPPPVVNYPEDERRDAILENVDELVAKLTDEAGLTPGQRTQVEALLRQQAETAFAITTQNTDTDFQNVAPLLSALRTETEARLAEVLTAEQLAVYHQYRRPPSR